MLIALTNLDIASEHEQGILCTDISDHYAIFHIAGNISHDNHKNLAKTRLIRDMRRQNIEKFTNEMQQTIGTVLLTYRMHRHLTLKFIELFVRNTKCFPYQKINKPYYDNKPWLTNAMKESINCISSVIRLMHLMGATKGIESIETN